MDSDITDAVGSVDVDQTTVEAWFNSIIDAHETSSGDWAMFREGVTDGGVIAFDQAVKFLRHVEDNGGMDLVGRLAAVGVAELVREYGDTRAAQVGAAEPAADIEIDYWAPSVQAYGGEWTDFDGTEGGWTAHRDQFYRATNDYHPNAYAEAYARLSPLDTVPMAERIAALRQLGFPVTTTAQATADPWARLVAALGAGWAAFTGSQESWTAVRDQFYRDANALDPELYATAYNRLNPLETQPMATRIATLRAAGLNITAQPVAQPQQSAQPGVVQDGAGLSDAEVTAILGRAVLDAIG